jgi:A/G-specific adenine glycosylase
MRFQTTSPVPAIESKIRRSLPKLYAWYRKSHRPLPWRTRPTPYRTAVAEFMCQQTRIATVIPYYLRWMRTFPNWSRLARSSPSRVLRLWEGLGYYRRARFLHSLAKAVIRLPGKELPADPCALHKLPGIGDYTAGAIASIAFGHPAAAFDGNVVRVLGRLAAQSGRTPELAALRSLAGRLVPRRHPGLHNQALMELGALICLPKFPRCYACPLRKNCPSRKKLPSSSRRKAAPTLQSEYILVVRRRSLIWLTQNHTQGRWRGLHLLPTVSRRPRGLAKAQIRYPFTRYVVHAAVFVTREPPVGFPGRWMKPMEVRQATLPTPHRKILDSLGIG